MTYLVLKHLHMLTVAVSGLLFALRGYWMLTDSPRRTARWARIVPHVNDTVLLAAGVGMAVMGGISPTANPWLATKLGGLVVYIVLGMVALRFGRTRSVRALAYFAALAVFLYVVGVAITKSPALS